MKEITVSNPLDDDAEEIAFTIPGTRLGERADERFVCRAHPPYEARRMVTRPTVDIAGFIRLCLVTEDEARWDKLLVDKDFDVHPDAVKEVYMALLEHYGQRPTQASTASGSGRDDTEASSPDAGPSADSTSDS